MLLRLDSFLEPNRIDTRNEGCQRLGRWLTHRESAVVNSVQKTYINPIMVIVELPRPSAFVSTRQVQNDSQQEVGQALQKQGEGRRRCSTSRRNIIEILLSHW